MGIDPKEPPAPAQDTAAVTVAAAPTTDAAPRPAGDPAADGSDQAAERPPHGAAVAPDGGTWHPPPPARLEYEVTGDARGLSYRASAVLDWQPDGTRYRAELSLQAFLVGGRTQISQGRLTTHGPQPGLFQDRARRERSLTFEWPTPDAPGHARTEAGTRLEALPPGTQDRLTVFVQLGGALDVAHATAGQRWSVPVAGQTRMETWTFEVIGRERLALPAGVLEAVHLRRVPGHERTTGVDLWYAAAVPGLPVRIVLQQADGDRVDQRLRAWQGTATRP